MTQAKQVPNVADDRLCWLAVRDQLKANSRKVGLSGWLMLLTLSATRFIRGRQREAAAEQMFEYAIAVDAASETLSADERRHLRATGEVPGWFLADVERRAAELRKRR